MSMGAGRRGEKRTCGARADFGSQPRSGREVGGVLQRCKVSCLFLVWRE